MVSCSFNRRRRSSSSSSSNSTNSRPDPIKAPQHCKVVGEALAQRLDQILRVVRSGRLMPRQAAMRWGNRSLPGAQGVDGSLWQTRELEGGDSLLRQTSGGRSRQQMGSSIRTLVTLSAGTAES